MAVVKSLKNKKHKREWVHNLRYTLNLRHKFYKFNLYKNQKNRYVMHKLNKISRSYIKQKSITLFFYKC